MNIFLSPPISAYSMDELKSYKFEVKKILDELRKKHNVCSEIDNINDESDYETPEKSISKDLDSIQSCDLFVLHYPRKMATSALMELGFAIAFKKRLLIICPSISTLPYLAQGVTSYCPGSVILETKSFDSSIVKEIYAVLRL